MAICCWKYYAPACGEYFMKKEGCGLLAAWMAVYMGFVCLCTGLNVSTIHRTHCMFCIKATVCLLSTVTKQRSRPSMLLDSRVCQKRRMGVSTHYRQTHPISHPSGWQSNGFCGPLRPHTHKPLHSRPQITSTLTLTNDILQ